MKMRGVPIGAAIALTTLLVMSPVAQAASWQSVSTPTSVLLRSVDFYDDSLGLAVGVGNEVLRTTDGGTTWTQIAGGFFSSGWYDVAWGSPTTAYVVGVNAIFQPMFGMTTDGGQTWDGEVFYINNNEGTLRGVAVSATNVLVAATLWNGEGVILQKPLLSAPAVPSTWTPVLTVPQPIVGIDADGLIAAAVGADGSVYTSHTAGLTWAPAVSPTHAFLYDVAVTGATMVAVGDQGTTISSSDFGLTWQTAEPVVETRLRGVDLGAEGTAVAVGDDGVVLTSTDAGASWTVEASGTSASLWGAAAHDGLGGTTAWAVGTGGTALVRHG